MASAPRAGGRFITIGGGAFRIAQDRAFHDIGRKPEGEIGGGPRRRATTRLKVHGPAA